jgi:hypothetical protein
MGGELPPAEMSPRLRARLKAIHNGARSHFGKPARSPDSKEASAGAQANKISARAALSGVSTGIRTQSDTIEPKVRPRRR